MRIYTSVPCLLELQAGLIICVIKAYFLNSPTQNGPILKYESHKKKARRLRKTLRRQSVTERRRPGHGSKNNGTRVISAPNQLSFSKNSADTLGFLERLKVGTLLEPKVKRRGKLVKKPIFVDLSPIKQISVPAAVVLAAELHRWVLLSGGRNLRARNLKRWDPRVRTMMGTLGALELLGINSTGEYQYDHKSQVVLMPLESGLKSDGPAVDRLQQWVSRLSKIFEPKPYVFDGLTEAILNAIDHAYMPSEGETRFPYAGHRWWATCSVDPVKSSFRFFVYDQGIGIPATIGAQPNWREPVALMMSKLGLHTSDASIIEGAFEVGRTRTKLEERGKGLRQMHDIIVKAGVGTMRILSGHGDILLNKGGVIVKSNHSSHIGGTMIEWSIPIDAFGQNE
jgi:hypothetical protein